MPTINLSMRAVSARVSAAALALALAACSSGGGDGDDTADLGNGVTMPAAQAAYDDATRVIDQIPTPQTNGSVPLSPQDITAVASNFDAVADQLIAQ